MYFIMSPLDCPNMEYLTMTVDSYRNGMKNGVEIDPKEINALLDLDWMYEDRTEYNKKFPPDNQLVELFDLGSLRRESLESIDSAYQQYLRPLRYVMGTEHEEYLAGMESYRRVVVKVLDMEAKQYRNREEMERKWHERSAIAAPGRAYVALSHLPGKQIPMPLMTSCVMEDIQECLGDVDAAITEVSICSGL
jgi:hypothetical protein